MVPDDDTSTDAGICTDAPDAAPERLSVPGLVGTDALRYDPESDAYRSTFDPQSDAPSAVLVNAVAAVLDRSPVDLDPLYTALDPDALDSLCPESTVGCESNAVHVTVTYHDLDVTLHSDGVVEVSTADDPTPGDGSLEPV